MHIYIYICCACGGTRKPHMPVKKYYIYIYIYISPQKTHFTTRWIDRWVDFSTFPTRNGGPRKLPRRRNRSGFGSPGASRPGLTRSGISDLGKSLENHGKSWGHWGLNCLESRFLLIFLKCWTLSLLSFMRRIMDVHEIVRLVIRAGFHFRRCSMKTWIELGHTSVPKKTWMFDY